MNPLTHAYFTLQLFKDHPLTQDQQDHLLVGSIIPDISQLGLINSYRTHTQGLKFFQQAKNSLHRYFALGVIFHGEEPAGLDYYSHKKDGYLNLKRKPVAKILAKYRSQVGKVKNSLAHNIIEFTLDYSVAQKDPFLIKKVESAFLNPKIQKTAYHFFRFFNVPEKKAEKINRYLNNKHLHHFFRNSQTLAGMANNWLNIKFYRNLKQGRHLPFREKIKKLTQLSYFNLKRRLHNKRIIQMFKETSAYLEKDCYQFLSQTQKDLLSLKNELLPPLLKKS